MKLVTAMIIKSGASYYTENSDLVITIIKVRYRADDYFKAKAKISNRYNGIIYQNKNYKIYYKNISHWKILDE